MIAVYWLEHGSERAQPQAEYFAPDQLSEALRFAENLRARRNAGEPLSHVAIQSELPQNVGKPGVADPPKDYAHYKRRIDPAVKLGRPSGSDPELNRP
jgi:hypothetical protein